MSPHSPHFDSNSVSLIIKMYIFTLKNIYYAGAVYEVAGIFLMLLSYVLKYYSKNNAKIPLVINFFLTNFKKIINKNNIFKFCMIAIALNFILARYGSKFESSAVKDGLFSVHNIILVIVCLFISAMFFLRYIVESILISEKKTTQEEIQDDNLVMAVGFFLFMMGIFVQIIAD